MMAGAHLDSVNAGPGIQDNGSGQRCHFGGRGTNGQGQASQQGALCLVGSGGGQAGRVDLLREQPLGSRTQAKSPFT